MLLPKFEITTENEMDRINDDTDSKRRYMYRIYFQHHTSWINKCMLRHYNLLILTLWIYNHCKTYTHNTQ